jgi:hypothetical protein
MDRRRAYELWHEYGYKNRPAWVREHRDELHEHIDTSEDIPDGPIYEVEAWLDRFKGTVTRQLNDDADGTDPQDEEVAA